MRRPTSKPGCSLSPEPPNGPRLPSNAPCTSPTRRPPMAGSLHMQMVRASLRRQLLSMCRKPAPRRGTRRAHTHSSISGQSWTSRQEALSTWPGFVDYEKIYHLKNSPPKANEMYGVGVSIERTPESLGSPAGLTVGGVAHPKPFRR